MCPSSYQVGQDTLTFVAGCAPITSKINLLASEMWRDATNYVSRTLATLDHMLEGRLTVNIISSDFPGQVEDDAAISAFSGSCTNFKASLDSR